MYLLNRIHVYVNNLFFARKPVQTFTVLDTKTLNKSRSIKNYVFIIDCVNLFLIQFCHSPCRRYAQQTVGT